MGSEDCIFCKIATGAIGAKTAYEDDDIIAFHDIAPAAPVHVLVVPKRHIPTVTDLGKEDPPLAGRMVQVAAQVAESLGVAQDGYRLVFNCNVHGGQEVFHVHLHVLGGRPLGKMG